jgi:Fe-Mn family superoxide dismutase
MKGKLIVIRHGEAESNRDGYAAGWLDARLTPKGLEQARKAGENLKKRGIKFDIAFTSKLSRATDTLDIILKSMGQSGIPVIRSEELNERYQGSWEGKKKSDLAKMYGGEDKLKVLKREYEFRPPAGEDGRKAETFEEVKRRVSRFYEGSVARHLDRGKTVLMVIHNGSMRGLVSHLEELGEEETMELDFENAEPYTLEEGYDMIRESENRNSKFELPPLPYPAGHLEPVIDSETMEIHHGKHHRGYVDKLNEALEKHPELRSRKIEDLLSGIDSLPEDVRQAVRDNGGGHFNHTLFWNVMTSEREYSPPSKALAEMIDSSFGSMDGFKREFSEAAKKRFGSGWAWLIQLKDGGLRVTSTANQDTPLKEGKPILGLDVWEHAYYLKYRNKRQDYVEGFFRIIDWKGVERNLGKR